MIALLASSWVLLWHRMCVGLTIGRRRGVEQQIKGGLGLSVWEAPACRAPQAVGPVLLGGAVGADSGSTALQGRASAVLGGVDSGTRAACFVLCALPGSRVVWVCCSSQQLWQLGLAPARPVCVLH